MSDRSLLERIMLRCFNIFRKCFESTRTADRNLKSIDSYINEFCSMASSQPFQDITYNAYFVEQSILDVTNFGQEGAPPETYTDFDSMIEHLRNAVKSLPADLQVKYDSMLAGITPPPAAPKVLLFQNPVMREPQAQRVEQQNKKPRNTSAKLAEDEAKKLMPSTPVRRRSSKY